MDEDFIVDALVEYLLERKCTVEELDRYYNLYTFATDVLSIDDPPGHLILCNINPFEVWRRNGTWRFVD